RLTRLSCPTWRPWLLVKIRSSGLENFDLILCALSIETSCADSGTARRQDGQSPRDDTSNPGCSAAPLYFSAAPTVDTAAPRMSGLSKTHGFAIPTGQNVNSWGRTTRGATM